MNSSIILNSIIVAIILLVRLHIHLGLELLQLGQAQLVRARHRDGRHLARRGGGLPRTVGDQKLGAPRAALTSLGAEFPRCGFRIDGA